MPKTKAVTKSTKPLRVPSVWKLTKTTALLLWDYKVLFVWIIAIYGLLNVILVQGLASGTDVGSLKGQLNQVFSGHFGALASSLGVLVVLIGSTGNHSSAAAAPYQLILGLIGSLAIIWALRQVVSGQIIRARDAYYRGMFPLVPFVLILLVIGLQLLPLLIGSTIYSTVITGGIAVLAVEKILWTLLFIALALASVYMLSSSLMALYIVTLPDMAPVKALRSARDLVRGRRWTIIRKIVSLPLVLLAVAVVIMVPVILFVTPLTQFVFFLLSTFGLLGFHAYMYVLYREVLR